MSTYEKDRDREREREREGGRERATLVVLVESLPQVEGESSF